MEIKIQCSCGQRYKFDTEPINGRLPGPVFCPICQNEGTMEANRIVKEKLEAERLGTETRLHIAQEEPTDLSLVPEPSPRQRVIAERPRKAGWWRQLVHARAR